MSATRVLVVDDQAVIRAGLRLIVDNEPDLTVVGEAGDGQEAVRAAASARPDVVLMDVAMPTLNGIEATRQIRTRGDGGSGDGDGGSGGGGGSSGGGSGGGGGSSGGTPVTVDYAVIDTNGDRESVSVGGTFPSEDPLFRLASLTSTKASIGLVSGSFSNGREIVKVAVGDSITLVSQPDGTRYKITIVSVG